MTRRRLLAVGGYCPPRYGDPGLLLPLYFRPKVAKTVPLGIVPHVSHFGVVKKQYQNQEAEGRVKVIDLRTKDVEAIVRQLMACEKIVSSSLHGLIVSDAYGIPNKWVQFNKNGVRGDNIKYYDYFASVGRVDRTFLDCRTYKKLPSNVAELVQPVQTPGMDIKTFKSTFLFIRHKRVSSRTRAFY